MTHRVVAAVGDSHVLRIGAATLAFILANVVLRLIYLALGSGASVVGVISLLLELLIALGAGLWWTRLERPVMVVLDVLVATVIGSLAVVLVVPLIFGGAISNAKLALGQLGVAVVLGLVGGITGTFLTVAAGADLGSRQREAAADYHARRSKYR